MSENSKRLKVLANILILCKLLLLAEAVTIRDDYSSSSTTTTSLPSTILPAPTTSHKHNASNIDSAGNPSKRDIKVTDLTGTIPAPKSYDDPPPEYYRWVVALFQVKV